MAEKGSSAEDKALRTRVSIRNVLTRGAFFRTLGYGQLPASAQRSESAQLDYLQRLIEQAEREKGYVFGTDQDNGPRPTPDSVGGLFGFDWRSSQWDNGRDPAEALQLALDVREIGPKKKDRKS